MQMDIDPPLDITTIHGWIYLRARSAPVTIPSKRIPWTDAPPELPAKEKPEMGIQDPIVKHTTKTRTSRSKHRSKRKHETRTDTQPPCSRPVYTFISVLGSSSICSLLGDRYSVPSRECNVVLAIASSSNNRK
ncbi:hypothetical protein V6N12_016356 [Hibiscus sabdariffa]|uniref:Uncharacterized protein n=1 Tax=Hibiscus sabdariffa TaxID=183260 RepID=A0ABR2CDC2_9ROSI